MINWGILGCGGIANKFAHDLNMVDDCKLFGVGSRSIDKAISFAKLNNATKAFGSYEELVQDENIDVIYVATPHPYHKDNTILCLNNGKHVLCEKPFAMNSTEVAEMIKAAKLNNKFLMEAIWTQFFPYMSKLKEIIAEGRLGDIKMIEADFGFKADFNPHSRLFDINLGGGALLDIGIYPLFLCHSLLGPPSAINSVATIGKTNVDESTCMSLKWDSGVLASLNCTVLTDTKSVAKIFGTEAYVEIDSRWHESKSMSIKNRDGIVETFSFEDDYKGYAYEIQEVNDCLKNSKTESETLPLQFSKELIDSLDKIRDQIGLTYPADNI